MSYFHLIPIGGTRLWHEDRETGTLVEVCPVDSKGGVRRKDDGVLSSLEMPEKRKLPWRKVDWKCTERTCPCIGCCVEKR